MNIDQSPLPCAPLLLWHHTPTRYAVCSMCTIPHHDDPVFSFVTLNLLNGEVKINCRHNPITELLVHDVQKPPIMGTNLRHAINMWILQARRIIRIAGEIPVWH